MAQPLDYFSLKSPSRGPAPKIRYRKSYYAALFSLFLVIVYFGSHYFMFGKLTGLTGADFEDFVKLRCVPAVMAVKQYQRDTGHLPSRIEDLEPTYLPAYSYQTGYIEGNAVKFIGRDSHIISYSLVPGQEGWSVNGPFYTGPIALSTVTIPPATRPATNTGGN